MRSWLWIALRAGFVGQDLTRRESDFQARQMAIAA